jgi:uncharacterized cupredoxin-like copper-binding protein
MIGPAPKRSLARSMIGPWIVTLLLGAVGLFANIGSAHAQACPQTKAGTKYKVKIETAPAGATVYLDRKDCGAVGVTPWNGTLAAGDITVIVELDGYNPESKPLKVARSRTGSSLFVPLTKKNDPPKIDIRADADKSLFGAQVFIDGQGQGQAPTIVTTTPGRHLVEIRKDGFETLSSWIEVKENQTATLSPQLKAIAKPTFGTIVVEADVPDAEVYIDGNKHPDNTPAVVANVVEGLHVVEVRKSPALPWKQTVQVVANQQVKVRAELKSTINGQGGVIRVISNVADAHAFIDGTDMGQVPVDIKDVKAGEHVIEVKAKGYQTHVEKVTTNAGQSQVMKVDLNAEGPSGQGVLKVISQVPDADVYLDGAAVGKAPLDKKIDSGAHKILVKLNGYKDFSQDVRLEGGQTLTVTAEMKAVGRLRVLSTPDGAAVLVNGLPVGKTPLDTEVEVGQSIIKVMSPGMKSEERTLNIVGGKTETISIELPIEGKSEVEMMDEQRGLSSFGARTLPRGRSTVDFNIGYPYYLQGRINVGGGKLAGLGFDAGVTIRSMFARSELGLGGRVRLADAEPFSAGIFTDLYWGSKLLDNSGRNGLTFDVGAVASLTALTHVTISMRAYLNMWTDRHCQSDKTSTDSLSICKAYAEGTLDGTTRDRVETLTGQKGADFFSRDQGIRLMMSIIAEIALQQRWNAFGILEGAPFQSERALFTNVFAHSMPSSDFGLYLRLGLSYKF